MSLPEVLLWDRLRGTKAGVKFRRQHPIGPYVADFYCSAVRFVVEIDGETHNSGENIARDQKRDAFLIENGYQVLRVSAAEVLKEPDRVAAAIGDKVREVARATSPLHRCAVPLPAGGEDL